MKTDTLTRYLEEKKFKMTFVNIYDSLIAIKIENSNIVIIAGNHAELRQNEKR